MGWDGIVREAGGLCSKVGLPHVARKDIHREVVKKAMQYHHLKQVKEEMEP